jgi:hypothetical protein
MPPRVAGPKYFDAHPGAVDEAPRNGGAVSTQKDLIAELQKEDAAIPERLKGWSGRSEFSHECIQGPHSAWEGNSPDR